MERRSIILRIYREGKLVNNLCDYDTSVRILAKPGGEVVYSARSSDKQNRVLYLDEGYAYVEVPTSLLEELRPYDLEVSLYNAGTSEVLLQKTLKSAIVFKHEFNHNGLNYEFAIEK